MVDWVLLAVLVVVWALVLLPRKPGPARSPIRKELVAIASLQRGDRRRVLMPPRSASLTDPSRARNRARRRRRRVLLVMLEAMAVTALIGAFPPLRAMWGVTALLSGFFAAYVAMLLRAKRAPSPSRARVVTGRAAGGSGRREEAPGVVVIPLVSRGRRTGTGG